MKRRKDKLHKGKKPAATLRAVAELVRLTASTVSHVLNNSPASRSVPEQTKKRILAAARELNYHPNFFARSLKVKRSYTIGVIAEEIGDAYGSLVISGIERYLRQQNFFFLTVAHRHDENLLATYSHMLRQRGAEGFITIDTVLTEEPPLPTVAVAGHHRFEGVTNLILDHRHAASLALKHLVDLGHEDIAFMKGSPLSSDSSDRWDAICDVAKQFGIRMRPELIVQLEGDDPTPNLGYPFAKELLARKQRFTALFAYNDMSAIGSMRACQEAGLRVPQDISVVGFDDIQNAAYTNPRLTTVRQPLQKMGEIAARTLLDRIENRMKWVPEITIEPELMVRDSTAPASSRRGLTFSSESVGAHADPSRGINSLPNFYSSQGEQKRERRRRKSDGPAQTEQPRRQPPSGSDSLLKASVTNREIEATLKKNVAATIH